ncbi:chemoreceptor glutamine deamidase CheD [Shewanella sp. NIFS-20-20]|uniref:chemoreceptor glutamine deamidase CheD n=1 Tax=Shewanella sp. NIFS-20-20 TaxID=2853806 RepID=UPI001C44A462|nr:chemoreceptor glutamine deamidase CheD [Shewanella sp. NIFS-20-20]MBV7316189.1 chemoreceptor glutamine deamidase CheD [Shewanella sp. NIFS-20-20]
MQSTSSLVYPGFEEINRTWDKKHGKFVARVNPGEYYLTGIDELVFTRLGSCIAACIYDSEIKIGGLNHFLLPKGGNLDRADDADNYSCRYGNWAMEQLINGILSKGGKRCNLKAKVFGGASIGNQITTNVGQMNIDFVYRYLATENIPILSQDVGGTWPRKVLFNPTTGKVLLKRLASEPIEVITKQEGRYFTSICKKSQKGDIELFD